YILHEIASCKDFGVALPVKRGGWILRFQGDLVAGKAFFSIAVYGVVIRLDRDDITLQVFLLPGAPAYNKQGDLLSPILFNIVVDMLAVGVISEKTNSLSIFMLSFFESLKEIKKNITYSS
ncbi:hypothetical protein ACJX0J_015743, partial [Zea mays]